MIFFLPDMEEKRLKIHDGKVITLKSNTRWCSDSFSIQCFNGDRVHVAFAMDTCDREVMSWVASTIGTDGAAMQLIYADETCSLGVHIMLEELGIPYEGIKLSLKDKTVLNSFNPKSYVPAIILNDGTLMTEAVSILQYLSENHGQAFLPKTPMEKAKCIEWLCFLVPRFTKGPFLSSIRMKLAIHSINQL